LLRHPVVGDLDLPFEALPLAAGSSWNLVAYTPEPGSAAHDALALLASWAATEAQAGPTDTSPAGTTGPGAQRTTNS
jgi:hypothetical protein